MTPLADIDALYTFLGVTTGGDDFDQALELSSGKIRSEAKQTISAVVDDVVTLRGTWDDTLYVPEIPVTGVSVVKINGVTITESLYTWTPDGAIETGRAGLPVLNWPEGIFGWSGHKSIVEITYSHGYDPVPDEIIGLCLELAARKLGTAPGGAIQSETIGAYSVRYGAAGLALSADEKKMLRRYRRQSGVVHVRG